MMKDDELRSQLRKKKDAEFLNCTTIATPKRGETSYATGYEWPTRKIILVHDGGISPGTGLPRDQFSGTKKPG